MAIDVNFISKASRATKMNFESILLAVDLSAASLENSYIDA